MDVELIVSLIMFSLFLGALAMVPPHDCGAPYCGPGCVRRRKK